MREIENYIPRGVDIASRILSKPAPYLVYADPDIDGAVSAELVLRLMRKYSRPHQIYINENRQHGFKMPEHLVEKMVGYTLILVDATMTREEVTNLVNKGINVINIDHHHLDYEELVHITNPTLNTEGVIINNQYPFEPENKRFLSGAGVVYYVFNSLFPDLYGRDEQALVGLSLLSDIRALDEQLARDFLNITYNHKSDYMAYLVRIVEPKMDFGFGLPTFDRNYIDYTFSPRVNALFRLNKGYEALDLFAKKYENTGQLDVYRNIQNAIQDTILENLQGNEYSNVHFKFVDSDLPLPYAFEITNFVGLSCSKYLRNGKTTIIFVRENGIVKRGSLRGLCDDVDYLSILRQHGVKAEGHHNACGVTYIDFENTDFESINRAIAEAEHGYEERKYLNRIIPVQNLQLFLNGKAGEIADWNNYVRDNKRIYLQYMGDSIVEEARGKAMFHIVDGVKVLGFNHETKINGNLILPIKERGQYINFFLHKR